LNQFGPQLLDELALVGTDYVRVSLKRELRIRVTEPLLPHLDGNVRLVEQSSQVSKFQTFDQQIADQFNDDRLVARLTALFGGLALLLATIGLYGLTAYTVARRTSEIGIRIALGANPVGVTAMVLRGALLQTLVGLLIGIPAALLCVRFVESQLYEIKGMDYTVLLTAIATLAAASALAGFLPARRAALTDPAKTLRTE
jgi:macrolide transport system ATP-binding/permease protein